MKLNSEKMIAAHFKRQADLSKAASGFGIDADLEIDSDDPIVRSSSQRELKRRKAEYKLGEKVLKKYSLTYSEKVMNGINPRVPEDAIDYIIVDAGHIATAAASCAAIFKKR